MNCYSCIIPVYNEEARIRGVLEAVTQVKKIAEIICVDDGSTDNSAKVIEECFSQVKLIRHDNNLGKTAAVITGLNLAEHDIIFLLDSDLVGLKSAEINNAIGFFEQNDLDCLLLNTIPTSLAEKFLRKIFRCLLLAAGNRIIRKQYLKDSLKSGNFKSYHLEIAQNKYLMENNKNVAYMDISAENVIKVSKKGLFKGMLAEVAMWCQIITYAGLAFFIKQSLFFARRKVF